MTLCLLPLAKKVFEKGFTLTSKKLLLDENHFPYDPELNCIDMGDKKENDRSTSPQSIPYHY